MGWNKIFKSLSMETFRLTNHRICRLCKLISKCGYPGSLIIFLAIILNRSACFAQAPGGALPTTSLGGNAGQAIEMDIRDNGFVTQIPGASAKTKGSSLLYEQWLPANLDFGAKGKAEGLYIRYDILNLLIHIRLKDKIKSIDGSIVDRFSLTDSSGRIHNYINCNKFTSEKTPYIGFFEILTEGNYQLFLKTDAVIIEANYNAALDLGEKDNEISQKSAYYIARDKEVIKVTSSKKTLLKGFPEIKGLDKYIKSEKINLRQATDLIKVVAFMNNN
jgi:hypothetical protein